MAERVVCQKCGSESGDDWSQCQGACPMPGSPFYQPELVVAVKEQERCGCGKETKLVTSMVGAALGRGWHKVHKDNTPFGPDCRQEQPGPIITPDCPKGHPHGEPCIDCIVEEAEQEQPAQPSREAMEAARAVFEANRDCIVASRAIDAIARAISSFAAAKDEEIKRLEAIVVGLTEGWKDASGRATTHAEQVKALMETIGRLQVRRRNNAEHSLHLVEIERDLYAVAKVLSGKT